jgi:Fe-S-cluster containining protein
MPRDSLAAGRARLANPALPLVRLLQLLYLTGPFEMVAAVLEELPAPLDTGNVIYPRPGALLRPYLPDLRQFERLKHPQAAVCSIHDEEGKLLDAFTATELWVSQQVLNRELEQINSLLCGPCGCTLCCTGPAATMHQDFFEIPLAPEEIDLFALPRTDSEDSHRQTASSEPPLEVAGRPFYENGPGLYHWQTGWSLILPQGSACPQLEPSTGRCRTYRQRPDVCRRPQIFAYALERWPDGDTSSEGEWLPAFIARRKLLAIWDCPYVRELKDEIARYAELSGLEPVFRSNKG